MAVSNEPFPKTHSSLRTAAAIYVGDNAVLPQVERDLIMDAKDEVLPRTLALCHLLVFSRLQDSLQLCCPESPGSSSFSLPDTGPRFLIPSTSQSLPKLSGAKCSLQHVDSAAVKIKKMVFSRAPFLVLMEMENTSFPKCRVAGEKMGAYFNEEADLEKFCEEAAEVETCVVCER